jgi:hypothetical protein
LICHSRESGNPESRDWMPAFAGMTAIPAARISALGHIATRRLDLGIDHGVIERGIRLHYDEMGSAGYATVQRIKC